MGLKKLYLAGAINGKDDDEVFGWRRQATEALQDLYEIHDPAERDFRGSEAANVKEIVESDLAEIWEMDAILARVTSPSWGTAMEIHESCRVRVPVLSFGAGDKPSPWLLYHTTHVSTLEVACSLLRLAELPVPTFEEQAAKVVQLAQELEDAKRKLSLFDRKEKVPEPS